MPALNSLASESYDGASLYGDKVHFVHVYVVEPHPQAPAPSPYRGSVWEAAYSSVGQAYSYAERVANARQVEPSIASGQLLLVDELGEQGSNNPVWCTYGPCPNCAYLIDQDGTVAATQSWVNDDDLRRDIDALLAP